MKILIIGENNKLSSKDEVIGCFYPKGSIIYFNTWNELINFVEKLPEDAVNYLDNPDLIGMYFTRDYFYIYKEPVEEVKDE